MSRSTFFRRITLLVLLALAVYLAGNWRTALFDCDEGWYAEISHEMLVTGNWIVPKYLGEVFPGKPPLTFWCQATCMSVFGANEFSARLPSAVASSVLLAVLGIAIGRAIGFQRAMWTVIILGSSGMLIGLSKMCLIDSVLLLWVASSQLCLYAIYRNRGGWTAVVLFWILVGLALLTKGPAILGYHGGALLALAALDVGKDWRSPGAWWRAVKWWWQARPWVGVPIATGIFGSWAYLVMRREPAFFGMTIGHNWIKPIFVSPIEGHPSFTGFYLLAIWIVWMPWSIFLVGAIANGWRNRGLAPVRFAFAAVIGPWIVIEVVRQKLPHYLLPLFPALAFLTADWLVRVIRNRKAYYKPVMAQVINATWALGIIAGTLVPMLSVWAPFRFANLPWISLVSMMVLGLAWAGVGYWRLHQSRMGLAAGSMAVGSVMCGVLLFSFLLPGFGFVRIPQAVAGFLVEQGAVHRGDAIMLGAGADGYNPPSLAFYQGGTIGDPLDPPPATTSLSDPVKYLNTAAVSDWPKWIVTSREIYEGLSAEKKRAVNVAATFRGLNEGRSDGIVEVVVLKKVE